MTIVVAWFVVEGGIALASWRLAILTAIATAVSVGKGKIW